MNVALKPVVLGVTTEAACLGLLLGMGHVGPCGPANLLGALFFVYMIPAFSVCEALHIKDPWGWIPAVILQTTFWSFAWFGVLRFINRILARRGQKV